MIKFPCEYCGKEFERPHKYRTENEAFHVYGCELEDVKKQLQDKNLGQMTKEMLFDKIRHISHVASFNGRDERYLNRMIECQKLLKTFNQN